MNEGYTRYLVYLDLSVKYGMSRKKTVEMSSKTLGVIMGNRRRNIGCARHLRPITIRVHSIYWRLRGRLSRWSFV